MNSSPPFLRRVGGIGWRLFAEIIRGHWKIENQLHWVKDVIFEEDKSQISDFQAASNWSILTTIGLNLFRSLGFSLKIFKN
jgi:predicted transposase YbfD/YdcC